MKASDFKFVNTIDDLKEVLPGVIYDISHRGGYVGYRSETVERAIGMQPGFLPGKVGAYCNYLGGGLRGSIAGSEFDRAPKRFQPVLKAIVKACKRAYENAEQEILEPDYWNDLGTSAAREAGIVSSY